MSENYKSMSPERFRELRAAGKLPHQQREATIHRNAEEQRAANRAAVQSQRQQAQHNKQVNELANRELDKLAATNVRSDESLLAMYRERKADAIRRGFNPRIWDESIAKIEAKQSEARAVAEFHHSDEYKTSVQTVEAVRSLIKKFNPDAIVNLDAALVVFEKSQDKDALFSTVSKLTTAATVEEAKQRALTNAKLSESRVTLAELSAEQLAESRANDACLAAAAKLKAAE